MDFPQAPILPQFVNTYLRWSLGGELVATGDAPAPATITWPVANTAFYVPFWLPWPYPVKRVWWYNASSVTTTNFDLGIYTADGTKLYSTGSTAASGASASQYVTPSPDFVLSPGRYYLALACSSITASRGGQGVTSVSIARLRMLGVLQEASALPLPATMTGVAVANSCYPLCGITRTSTGF